MHHSDLNFGSIVIVCYSRNAKFRWWSLGVMVPAKNIQGQKLLCYGLRLQSHMMTMASFGFLGYGPERFFYDQKTYTGADCQSGRSQEGTKTKKHKFHQVSGPFAVIVCILRPKFAGWNEATSDCPQAISSKHLLWTTSQLVGTLWFVDLRVGNMWHLQLPRSRDQGMLNVRKLFACLHYLGPKINLENCEDGDPLFSIPLPLRLAGNSRV